MTILARSSAAGPRDSEESDTLAEQIGLLYAGSRIVPANLINAVIVAAALWRSFPPAWLGVWIALTALVVVARLLLYWRYRRSASAGDPRRWARRYAVGALASGLLWGALCGALPFYGGPLDFLFVTLVAAAMSAAGMTSLSSYFPAYLCYLLPFIVPPGLAFLLTRGPDYPMLGALILIYGGVLAITGYNLSRSIVHTLSLKTANDRLNRSLTATHAELKLAREDKWRTFAHLSHELRTPLTAILGFSEAIRDELLGPIDNTRYRDYARHVHASGQHLLSLADEILALSQGEAGALPLTERVIDVAPLVVGCIKLIEERAGQQHLRIIRDIEDGLPPLRADETKLRQILLNLLTNAVKFTPEGGEITVAARLASDGGIVLSVADTGVGMAAADIPRALTPFVRLANALVQETEGVGLGLPLSKRLAELHGGELTITSEPGKGTTCTVRLPAARTVVGGLPRSEEQQRS